MKQLIVNADDFGLTEGVSQGILDAHWEGIVTSTTLMANGDGFGRGKRRRRPRPGLVGRGVSAFARRFRQRLTEAGLAR